MVLHAALRSAGNGLDCPLRTTTLPLNLHSLAVAGTKRRLTARRISQKEQRTEFVFPPLNLSASAGSKLRALDHVPRSRVEVTSNKQPQYNHGIADAKAGGSTTRYDRLLSQPVPPRRVVVALIVLLLYTSIIDI